MDLQNEVYKLQKINNIQSWAINQLRILVEHSNREWAGDEKSRILFELESEIKKIEKIHEEAPAPPEPIIHCANCGEIVPHEGEHLNEIYTDCDGGGWKCDASQAAAKDGE